MLQAVDPVLIMKTINFFQNNANLEKKLMYTPSEWI